MKEGILYSGIPSKEELMHSPGRPTEDRMQRGRVACIECVQEIPCNPCESACPFGAIHIGENITAVPVLEEEKCTGCGVCVAGCPGLAITVLDKSLGVEEGSIDFPYEYLPLPEKGAAVEAVGRDGAVLCTGRILGIKRLEKYDGTAIITMAVPIQFVETVKGMKRLTEEG